MNSRKLNLISLLTLIGLCGGCADTGPNTQQGAVGGAALGAIAGAIIGNNSGNHSAGNGAVVGALAGALLGGTMGNQVDHDRGTIYTSETQARRREVVLAEVPPPPPSMPSEVIPTQPVDGAIWVNGYWYFNQNARYEWVPGRWEMPPPSCRIFVTPHWAREGNGFVYVRGYWRV